MILVIDNYDSFVHNLARYLQRLGPATVVLRNDEITPREVLSLRPEAIILSPGPCTPAEAGCSLDLMRAAAGKVPILGVCLGHQTIAAALGGSVVRAEEPMHGRASEIEHDGDGLFAGLPNPLVVGRYHSLIVEEASLPSDLLVTARTSDGTVMSLEHCQWPIFGVQFHPESILTECGHALLANFLRLAGIHIVQDNEMMEMERPAELALDAVPVGPVTF
jgi:anthranilate synthase/aminodeoxychorismate synthase-like glutamine amidotransferase